MDISHCLLLASLFWRLVASATQCKLRQGSTCICDMDDGSGDYIDLTAVSNNGNNPQPFFKDVQGKTYKYSFNPCKAFAEDKCSGAAVCQAQHAVCGRMSSVSFDTTVTTPTLAYGDGDTLRKIKRVSIFALDCKPSVDHQLVFNEEKPEGNYHFTLTSSHACVQKPAPPPPKTTQPPPPAAPTTQARQHRKTEHNPISLGTILDICALFVVASYVAAGTAFMYVRRGARGREALPNYAFWIGIPGLIKEGALFIVEKVKGLRGLRSGYGSIDG